MECTMRKCSLCKVEILDSTNNCPLCHNILEWDGVEVEGMYPDARIVLRKNRIMENIVLFVSIVAFVVVVSLGKLLQWDFAWSLLVGLGLLYLNGVMRFTFSGKSTYMFRMTFSIVFLFVVLLLADFITGWQGWGINIVYPSMVILLVLGIVLRMCINHKTWYSYIVPLLGTVVLGAIGMILYVVKIITFPYVAWAAAGLSLFVFLGVVIIGDYRARTELKRRFHI